MTARMLSEHFSADEMHCPCCGQSIDPAFLEMLEQLRQAFGRPLRVSSASRCQEHNAKVKGSPRSMHLKGRAADLACLNAEDHFRLVDLAMRLGFTGIGTAATFVHVDNREGPPKLWTY